MLTIEITRPHFQGERWFVAILTNEEGDSLRIGHSKISPKGAVYRIIDIVIDGESIEMLG